MAALASSVSDMLPLLLAIACLGHFGLCVYSHNYWYGQALPRHGTNFVQLIHGVVLLGIPALFWFRGGYGMLLSFDANHPTWPTILTVGYFWLCCLIGLIVLPFITVKRLLRPSPVSLIRSQSNLVDVARTLAEPPLGSHKLRHLAKLPGNQVLMADFSERSLQLPRLHLAWHGLTVLHVSDLHFCGTPAQSYYEYVLGRCAEWEPDLVALTGDFVDDDPYRRWLLPLLSKLRWRVAAFAILGNHDQWYKPSRIRRRLERLGIQVLGNGWKNIEVRGQQMIVIGNERPWFRQPLSPVDAPKKIFRLCLSHTPDNMPWARREGIDLMLSGHVHGGQIRIPGIGSVIVPSQFGRRYDCGVFQEGPTVLHVSRGLGGEQALRFNCSPEVTLLTLVCH
jgi:uncharacterized protein